MYPFLFELRPAHAKERERERELFTVSSSEALSFYLRRRRWELKIDNNVYCEVVGSICRSWKEN